MIDPISRLESLIAGAEARFQTEFLSIVAALSTRIDIELIVTLMERGRIIEAFEIVEKAAARLGSVYTETFIRSGADTARWLNANVQEFTFDFDRVNDGAVNAMQQNKLRLVRGFTDTQRKATQQALLAGIEAGDNPREVARKIKNSIGLTPHQEQWIRNYEAELRGGNRAALERQLRDKRFDRTIARAIEEGKPLSDSQIEKMVARYRAGALRYRAETIARTEALRSVHEGSAEMYRQAVEDGTLQADQLTREWNTKIDERRRPSHAKMHGQKRIVGEMFESGAGHRTLNPGAFGVASEDIDCRCVVSTRITLDKLSGVSSVTIL